MEFQLDAFMDLDFMEEVFLGEELFGAADHPNPSSPCDTLSSRLFDSPSLSNLLEIRCEEPENRTQSVEERSSFSLNAPSLGCFQTEEVTRHQPVVQSSSSSAECTLKDYDYQLDEPALPTPNSSKERLDRVFKYIMEFHREGNALVQIWVPEMRGDQYVLTTCDQPFRLDRSCQRLVKYRTVSTNFCFSAEVDSKDALGLPGRVFVGKVPEWTPDVRFFRRCEYPRVNHAQRYDIRGSIALPVFERNNRCCLGVVEIVLTTEKINYTSDIEKICSALQAVNLGSSEVFNVPDVKVKGTPSKVRRYSYQVALPEIKEVLRIVCEKHNIPLAQTWMACAQHGRTGNRHSNENYMECVSTVDTACHVNDPYLLDFHEACSEHHLFKGQGIAGKAFLTNQPCFSSDLMTFSKTEYPLAHHARIFNLRGVVAVRLRTTQTGVCDFVLEFFLPTDCIALQEQKLMLASLSSTIKSACWSLRVVTREELEMETMLHHGSYFSPQGSHESQHLGQLEKPNTEIFEGCKFDPTESAFAFRVPTQWDEPEVMLPVKNILSEFKQDQQVLDDATNEYSNQTVYEHRVPIPETTERRRAKTEKSIGLEVLQKHFAGSLKDAAKSIGVCPTTLKRICRQHGITRWPSRKIKKVSHSLRKLQSVIDSVQGAEGAFPLSSYFAKSEDAPLADSTVKSAAMSSPLEQPQFADTKKELFNVHASASHSRSTTHSQCSSSSHSCSSGANDCADDTRMAVGNKPWVGKNNDKFLTGAATEMELHPSPEEPPDVLTQGLGLQSGHCFSKNPSFPVQYDQTRDLLRVKAIYGEEKVRLRLPLSCKLEELRQEIANRFNINTVTPMVLKYLDDDSDWVLLTRDADLQECIDIYNSSSTRTIKISVHPVLSFEDVRQVKG